MRILIGLLLAAMVVLATWKGSSFAENNTLVRDQLLSEAPVPATESLGLKEILAALDWSNDELRIKVDKSERKMSILVRDSLVKSYPFVLGLSPIGDKQMQGDK
jgi:murein L,D-transpeptidase YafK